MNLGKIIEVRNKTMNNLLKEQIKDLNRDISILGYEQKRKEVANK